MPDKRGGRTAGRIVETSGCDRVRVGERGPQRGCVRAFRGHENARVRDPNGRVRARGNSRDRDRARDRLCARVSCRPPFS